MINTEETVDRIRAFLQSNDQGMKDELRELASSFAEACTELNQRLHKCHRLLQQGLRSEAIHQAEQEPNLLDLVALVDFPERPTWDEFVRAHRLAAAPAAPTEIAAHLNEAYAQEDPLQDLLRSHRRLALARAPLRPRIDVMRKIAALDTNNPIWMDDVRLFEKVRMEQIKSEAASALNTRDASQLEQLLREVSSFDWAESFPTGLAEKIKTSLGQIRVSSAREALKELEVELNDAFAAMDLGRGRIARQKWNEIVRAAALPPAHATLDRAEPALLWLAEQDRREQEERAYQSAIRDLEEALEENDVPRAELEQLADAVLRLERGMPDLLQHRLQARLTALELAATRRFRLIVAAAVAGIVVTAGFAFVVLRRQWHTAEVTRAVAAIERLLEQGHLEEATRYVDNLTSANSAVVTDSAFVEAHTKLNDAQAKERDRVKQFAEALQAAENAPPRSADPPPLQTARRLARLDAEKAAVERVAAKCETAFREERARRDQAASPRIDALSARIAAIERETAHAQSAADLATPLREVQAELARLDAELPYLSEHLQILVGVLAKKVDAIRKEEGTLELGSRLETEVTRAISYSRTEPVAQSAPFVKALEALIKASPQSPRAAAFKETLAEQPCWDAVFAWHRLATTWASDDESQLKPEKARARSALCAKFLSDHPKFPDAAFVLHYQAVLDAIGRRDGADSAPRVRLTRLFSDLLVDNLWMLTVRRGSRDFHYYLKKQPPAVQITEFRYITDFDGNEANMIVNVGETVRLTVAPQSDIATQVKRKLIDDAILVNWDAAMIEILREIRAEPEIEPTLQLVLTEKVMAYAAEGSEFLRSALKSSRNIIALADVDTNANWMDPDDEKAIRWRPKAIEVLKALPDPATALEDVRKQQAAIREQFSHLPYPVGWLLKDDKGWHCRTGKALPEQGELFVAIPSGENDAAWRRIGRLSKAGPELMTDDSRNFVEGRPIFVVLRSAIGS